MILFWLRHKSGLLSVDRNLVRFYKDGRGVLLLFVVSTGRDPRPTLSVWETETDAISQESKSLLGWTYITMDFDLTFQWNVVLNICNYYKDIYVFSIYVDDGKDIDIDQYPTINHTKICRNNYILSAVF